MAGPGRHEVAGGRPPRRRLAILVAIVGVVSLAAAGVIGVGLVHPAIVGAVRGTPFPADYIDTGDVGLSVRRVPPSDDEPGAVADERLIAAIIADLTTFWSQAMPSLTGEPFVPLRGGLTAMDSAAATGSAPCVANPSQIVGNAFYCPGDDGIVYDAATLVPVLLHRYGIAGLVTTFAHEFGHAAQAEMSEAPARPSPNDSSHGSLISEARADCDAGAFLSWVVAGNAHHIHLGADNLVRAIGPLLDFADPATVSPTDPTAHGLALDRLTWVLRGFRGGARSCQQMATESLHPTLGEVPQPHTADGAAAPARFTSRRELVAAAVRSVDAFAGHGPTAAPPTPGASTDALMDAAGRYGQFAQATMIALTVGAGRYGEGAGASCFAGAWVASVFGHAQQGGLGSWPGDADEGLSAVRAQPHVTFDDLAGYADGFHSGVAACG